MGKGTSIEWTDVSWPVVNGCRRVSAGCENCYAERLTATRLSKTPKYQCLAVYGKNGPRWTGETRLWVPHLDLPMTIRKPSRIFVADMGDLFYEGVTDEDIAAIFGVMAACPQHTFQVLTKRPERMRAWFSALDACREAPGRDGEVRRCIAAADRRGLDREFHIDYRPWPLPNVWLGVSVENQATADERIPVLLETPAAVRWISYEPALGPVHFDPATLGPRGHLAETFGNPLINWVVCGGESGPGARPFDIAWARSTVNQCDEAGVPAFIKQLGARPFERRSCDAPACNCGGEHDHPITLDDRKGGDWGEWTGGPLTHLRVREFPEARP